MRNDSEFQNFDTTVRKVLSVSHEELQRREKEWKRAEQPKSGLGLYDLGFRVRQTIPPSSVAAALNSSKREFVADIICNSWNSI
jgi:hypothetical protein